MMMERDCFAAYAAECFSYDAETGVITWRERPRSHFKSEGAWKMFRKSYAGRAAGSPDKRGYIKICLDGKTYLAHRLAWLLSTGHWPKQHIDHVNGDTSDNRLSNLREATPRENQYNRRAVNGLKGVTYIGWRNRYKASISVEGNVKFLGYFRTEEEAHAAYANAAEKFHGEFARLI